MSTEPGAGHFDYLALTQFIHRRPLVASTHGGFFHTSFASRLKEIYFQTITRLASTAYDVLCASSEGDAVNFRRIALSKIVTIEDGVNVTKWKDCASITPQRTMIIIGRWSSNKAVPVLIDLVAALQKQGALWSLMIVGIPAQETASGLLDHAKRLGVEAQVHIYEGPSDAEIAGLVRHASYIASASRYEGFGNVEFWRVPSS